MSDRAQRKKKAIELMDLASRVAHSRQELPGVVKHEELISDTDERMVNHLADTFELSELQRAINVLDVAHTHAMVTWTPWPQHHLDSIRKRNV